MFCTTARSKANAVYDVLHVPEEDVILKYSDDKLEDKSNEVKEEQQNIIEYNLCIEALREEQNKSFISLREIHLMKK